MGVCVWGGGGGGNLFCALVLALVWYQSTMLEPTGHNVLELSESRHIVALV